jgi:hypothetical protein
LGLEGCHWSVQERGFTVHLGLHAVGFAGSNCKGRSADAKINCSLVRVYKLLEGRLRGWSGFQVCWQLEDALGQV